jgi:predicted TIM-barrel enzyme
LQHPLAVASGINESNVGDFVHLVSVFLVATGISETFNELSEEKMRNFKAKLQVKE